MNKRIDQLDSVRGIACASVFMSHLPLTSVGTPVILISIFKALGIVNGYGAVIMFFLLSGFVLSLPFLERKEIGYFKYLIRRIFRIYFPYLFAITFAIILSQIFLNHKINGVYELSDKFWKTKLSYNLIVQHLYFLGNIHSNSFNGVIWSLIHELRISLVFPFVMIFIKRSNLKINFIICLGLSVISGLNNVFHFQISNGYLITYFDSLNYLSIFILGGLLAKHKETFTSFLNNLSMKLKIVFLLGSFFAYNFSGTLVNFLYHFSQSSIIFHYSLILINFGVAIGASGFLIIALSSKQIRKILMIKPLTFLGKTSYSIYLYHLPIILCCIYLFQGIIPLWSILLISGFLTIIISFLSWYFIENYFIKLGKTFSAFNIRMKDKSIIHGNPLQK